MNERASPLPASASTPSDWDRRSVLRAGTLVLLLGAQQIARGASIVAVRVWPAPEYSRVTIESDIPLVTRQTFVQSPPRLAVDIEGIELNPAIRDLVAKVRADDPNIAGIRVGQNAPRIVRLVIDLKQEARPQVFSLKPVPPYQHRLVLDLYPAKPVDPLDALIAQHLRLGDIPAAPAAAASAPVPAPAPSTTASAPAPHDPLEALIAQHATQAERPALPATPAASAPAPAAAPPASVIASAPPPAPPLPPAVVLDPEPRPAPAPASGARTSRYIIVALDPGHGGEDPGAIGPGGTREKDVVLRVAHLLRDRINRSSSNGHPMRAYLTRDADYFVPLATRVQKARRVQADLFISIHADAFTRPSANGASVYALSEKGATSTAARWLANKENQADLVGGINVGSQDRHVQQALLDMSTTAQINDSLKLGTSLLGRIGKVGRLHKPRVEQAGFAVLKAPDIPSVLVETAFISNPDEEQKLRSNAYQRQLADAIMQGIQDYFDKHPPLARSRVL